MTNWALINKSRLRTGPYGSDESFGFNGAFRFKMDGEPKEIFCIASDGFLWKHVSVSFGPDPTTPRWEVMCFVKDLFWDPEEVVMQLHPRHSEYVDHHSGVLHLWSPTTPGISIPEPPSIMVGFKKKYVAPQD